MNTYCQSSGRIDSTDSIADLLKPLLKIVGISSLIGALCLSQGCSIPREVGLAMNERDCLESQAMKKDYITIEEHYRCELKHVELGVASAKDYKGPMKICYIPQESINSALLPPVVLEEWYDVCTNELVYSNVRDVPGLVRVSLPDPR